MRRIVLDCTQLVSREKMGPYLKKELGLEDWFTGNLDALNDCLSEIHESVDFVLTHDNVQGICRSPYAYKVLLIIARNVDANPYLKIHFHWS